MVLKSLLFNENRTIRAQLFTSFALILILVTGITLAVCYVFLFKMGEDAYTTSKSTIVDVTWDSLDSYAKELSLSIAQQLQVITSTGCLGSSLYAKFLNQYISEKEYKLRRQTSYREYYFNDPNCAYPNCPLDFGSLQGKSRIPWIPGFHYGSLDHTSVYMYDNQLKRAARDDVAWEDMTEANPVILRVIDALAFQDSDMKTMYSQGGNNTLFFYLGTKIEASDGKYYSLRRTYPGVPLNLSNYDSSKRGWFKNAPDDGYFLDAYKESFTGELVINLSSKKFVQDSNYSYTFVSASLMLLSNLQDLVNSVSDSNRGFAALVKYDTLEVLCWKKGYPISYNKSTSKFQLLASIDTGLADIDVRSNSHFEYTDINGTDWMVTSIPFFPTRRGTSLSNSLIVLVFNKKSYAEASLPNLRTNILSTESTVLVTTGIIIAGCFGSVLFLVAIVIIRITSPFEALRDISLQVLQILSEDENDRDYLQVIRHPLFSRSYTLFTDEMDALTNDFFQVVCRMNNNLQQKKSIPAFPENPFHTFEVNTWDSFYSKVFSGVSFANSLPNKQERQAVEAPIQELDFLGSLQLRRYMPVTQGVRILAGVDDNDIEIGRLDPVHPYPEVVAEASTYQEAYASSSAIAVDSGTLVNVSCLASIKSVFYFLAILIILTSLIILVITVSTLQKEGYQWMDSTGVDLNMKQMANLASIAMVKGVFVKHFFLQILVDIKVTGNYITNIINGKYVIPGEYLQSYSLDPGSPYASSFLSNDSYSGYLMPNDQGYVNHNSFITRNTSLLDIKYQSLIYDGSPLFLAQFGAESDGFFRHYPYSRSEAWSTTPSKCSVTSTVNPICQQNYLNSLCSGSGTSYPQYDPRCRSWYQFAKEQVDENEAYIMYPRFQSSTNEYVVTSVMKIMHGSEFIGVINSIYLVQVLSDAVNELKILDNGYSYIVDARNSTNIIMHPSSLCGDVLCSEEFSRDEFTIFYNTILQPIQENALSGSSKLVMSSYIKGGAEWRLSYSYVKVSSIYYAVISTVPFDDVIRGSRLVETSIDATVKHIIVVFVVCMLVVFSFLLYFIILLIQVIVDPINDLRRIASLLATCDLNSTVPNKSSSLDMKILLDAFSKLVVAIRFGNENFSRGNFVVARRVYNEALTLFTNTGNVKGLGACHNNLGAVEMSSGNFVQAEDHYNTAIQYCKDAISKAKSSEELVRLQRTLSNRRGNLAVLYLERTDMTSVKFKIALDLLEELFIEDKKIVYIVGCVLKQGYLGLHYLKQGEISSAYSILQNALNLVQNKNSSVINGGWDDEEACGAEQIGLFNLALLHVTAGSKLRVYEFDDEAEAALVKALTKPKRMHSISTEKILSYLLEYFKNTLNERCYGQVAAVANAYGFLSTLSKTTKRVVFCLDYSKSMSGTKIEAAIENIQSMFENHIQIGDTVMLMHFADEISVDFELTAKFARNNEIILSKINSLMSPNGGTAFYDSIYEAVLHLSRSPGINDWIIALTDGLDTSSIRTVSSVKRALSSSSIKLIVVGIGLDVQAAELTQLTTSPVKGVYVSAAEDKMSIDRAFRQVIEYISQEALVLEDM